MSGGALDAGLVHVRGARPSGAAPIDVISVQSQLVYGHAGNSAAAGPLRALGLRVAEVPTTLLSNAPVYPTTRGRVLPADWFADLLLGATERGLPARAAAVLTGYLGTAANGAALAAWIEREVARCPNLRFFLDPVLGDTHIGDYVEPGLAAIYRERLLPRAWLVVPNEYELRRLAGCDCAGERDYADAARGLLSAGPEWVVVHGLECAPGTLVTLAVGRHACHRLSSPRLPIDVTGTGDVFAALLTGFLLRGEAMPRALERAAAGVYRALVATLAAQYEELEVDGAAQAALADGSPPFAATDFG